MNSCLICGQKDLSQLIKVDNCIILECDNCNLALTKDKTKSDFDKLYKTSDLYQKDSYTQNSHLQTNKVKWIANNIKTSINSGTILDVGAGFGLLSSELLNNSKLIIEVLEPNLPLIFINKKKQIKQHKIKYEKFLMNPPNSEYNAVLFIDVLEHFPNPYFILSQTKKILNSDGKVIVNLPNYNSVMRRLVKNWSWWMVEDHYYHFSTKSLVKFFRSNGYKVELTTTYESFNDFKSNLDGNFVHIKNNLARKLIKLIYFSIFTPIYLITRKLFWKLGFGGLIFMIASKK